MLKRTAFIVVLCAASVSAAWAEPFVRRAGEWETTIDNGQPRILCFPTDVTLDKNYVTQPMSKLHAADCTITNMETVGAVTSYSIRCTVGGSPMTSSGTITATGPDSFTGKIHSHGGVIKMRNGKEVALSDMDIVTVSRRLGPCKPGD
jgi:hypothetical protein